MAVAVKSPPGAVTPMSFHRLASTSFFGVAYVLGSIGVVFYGIPSVWLATVGGPGSALAGLSFVNYALLGVVMLAAAVVLVMLGTRLAGPELPPGAHAGIGVGLLGLLAIALITIWVGNGLEYLVGAQNAALGLPATAALAVGMLFLLVRSYFRADAEKRFVALEEQGWFTLAPYKKTQGQRVRRGTLLAVLAILGCGVWVLLEHKTLEVLGGHWSLTIPFTATKVTVLRDIRFTVPILLAFASLWFAYRLVNFPLFADFLIATEAELNKVSWASRKRLVQDTIVVLTTVVLVTSFIFFVDLFWGWGLKQVGVLNLPEPKSEEVQLQNW